MMPQWLARLLHKFGYRRRYALPEEIPDFTDLRAEARAVATGKDLDDVLANLDQLEAAWRSRLDPAFKPTWKTP